jgi:hypothetical protein
MDDGGVGAAEVAAVKAVLAEPAEHRHHALADAVVEFGPSFVRVVDQISASPAAVQLPDAARQLLAELARQAAGLLNAWLTGERITSRADEGERRVLATRRLAAATPGDTVLARLAVDALLRLPDGHEQRDLALARNTLLGQVNDAQGPGGDVNDILVAAFYLLHHGLLAPEDSARLIRQALEAAHNPQAAPAAVRDLIRAAHDYCIVRAGEELLVSGSGFATWMAEAEKVLAYASADHKELGPRLTAMRARQFDVADDAQRAADAYAEFIDANLDAGTETVRWQVLSEATLRLQTGEYQRVLDRLTPLLPGLLDRYLTAVTDADVADAGFAHGRAVALVTSALIGLGRAEDAVTFVDTGKSLRLRYRTALRQHPAYPEILDLERAILAVSRGDVPTSGVSPPDASTDTEPDLAPRTRLLERYRRLRPDLSEHVGQARTIEQIAAVVDPQESVIVLAGLDDMTVIALITSPARLQVTALTSLPWSYWDDLLGESGWSGFLTAGRAEDGPDALQRVINRADNVIGQRIRKLLQQADPPAGSKVAIIPHRWLHLIPYWALPSLADIPVSVFSSADEFVTSRTREATASGRHCLVVENPTRDLMCSPAETESVLRLGIPSAPVLTSEEPGRATAEAIARSLTGSALFHFSGHAYSDRGNPDSCALLVSPSRELAVDPFPEWVTVAAGWRIAADRWRTADVPGAGRLSERASLPAGRLERRLERGSAPTLYALYAGGKLRRLGELWAVSDMLALGQTMPCQLAFLSACESGIAGGSSAYIDEYGGLPAALRLGGSDSVVCSMWDVDEGFTAIYVDRFYRELLAGHRDPVTIVRQVSRWFRQAPKPDVLRALDDLADAVRERSPRAAIMLEAYRGRIEERDSEVPYADAWEWASFYAIGGGRVDLVDLVSQKE